MSTFTVIEGDVVLRDESGNPVGTVQDGNTHRLQVEAKVVDGANSLSVNADGQAAVQNPSNLDAAVSTLATESTAAEIKDQLVLISGDLGTMATLATENTLATLATEATLSTLATENTVATLATETTLASLVTETTNAKDQLILAMESTLATEATAATLLTASSFETHVGEVQTSPTANTILGRLKDIVTELTERLGALGQSTMASSTPVAIASDQSRLDIVPRDTSGNALPVADNATPTSSTPGFYLMGVDDVNNKTRRLLCGSDGRLLVSANVQSPPNKTAVSVLASSSTDSTSGVDEDYVIPTDKTVTIQSFSGGAEAGTGGSKVQLYYATDSNKTSPTLIASVYVNGGSASDPVAYTSPAGTGSNRIFIRRTRFSATSAEVYGKWNGYY